MNSNIIPHVRGLKICRDELILELYDPEEFISIRGFAAIPDELKVINQWVCWKYKTKPGKKKPTKLPMNPRKPHLNASTNKPTSWGDFDTADKCVKKHKSTINGIGFVMTADDDFAGIDIDNCLVQKGDVAWEISAPIEPGSDYRIIPEAKRIIDSVNSYTELSVSGTGVHIFVRAPNGLSAKSINVKLTGESRIEFYSKGQYFICTGASVLGKCVLEDRQGELDALYLEFSGQSHIKVASPKTGDMQLMPEALSEPVDIDASGLPYSLVDKIRNGVEQGRRSEAMLSVASQLARHGLSAPEVLDIFTNPEYMIGEKGFEERGDNLDSVRDYLWKYHVSKAFEDGETLPTTALEDFKEIVLPTVENRLPEHLLHPPGVVGDLLEVAYRASDSDSRIIPLAAAFSAMGLIAANKYVVIGRAKRKTPLGLYIQVLAHSGAGKDAARTLLFSLEGKLDNAGGALGQILDQVKSGAALRNYFAGRKEGAYALFAPDEFGDYLSHASSPAGTHAADALKEMMAIYGYGCKRTGKTLYADDKRSYDGLVAPGFSIMATTTSVAYFGGASLVQKENGFQSRFLTFNVEEMGEIGGKDAEDLKIPPKLLQRIRAIRGIDTSIMNEDLFATGVDSNLVEDASTGLHYIPIHMSEASLELIRKFKSEERKLVQGDTEYGRLWNRITQNAIMVAGLLAIGCANDRSTVVIKDVYMRYATELVMWNTQRFVKLARRHLGETTESRARHLVYEIVAGANRLKDKRYAKYFKQGLMPESVLRQRFVTTKLPFRLLLEVTEHLQSAGHLEVRNIKSSGKKVKCYCALEPL